MNCVKKQIKTHRPPAQSPARPLTEATFRF
jgi:hypothetical protein